MSDERYVKQIISDVMEMAATIKFLEAKVAAAESWNAECADDHKQEFAAALRHAKAEVWREAARSCRGATFLKGAGIGHALIEQADIFDARAAQIEQGES